MSSRASTPIFDARGRGSKWRDPRTGRWTAAPEPEPQWFRVYVVRSGYSQGEEVVLELYTFTRSEREAEEALQQLESEAETRWDYAANSEIRYEGSEVEEVADEEVEHGSVWPNYGVVE